MPAFGTAQALEPENLHDDFGRLGPRFLNTYEGKLVGIARPIQGSFQASIFPSRLVGPDGATFLTTQPYPNYVVISYTWGRWKHPSRDLDTPVLGGHWNVPANHLFSREDLDAAVRKIADGGNAWLDVLCIPQIDKDPEHAQEIGKQSEIFRSASRAAVWLASGGEKTLAEICSWVPETSYLIRPDILRLPDMLDIRSGAIDLTETRRRLRLIASLTKQVPWTTSLWTLQEAALRLDAIFFDQKGNAVRHEKTGNPITIKHLIKTMRHVSESLQQIIDPLDEARNILNRPNLLNASEADIKDVLEALDAVNTINLHRLLSMNASELLLTSTHRTCERLHDRVYGIMGAIGVVVPVDYDKDASEIMDMFLVELHNQLPSEMQSFHRDSMRRPSTRPWLADESSRSLGIIRQLSAPPTRIFTGITTTGELAVSELIYISDCGLDALTARFLTEAVLPAFDTFAFSKMTNGAIHTKDSRTTGRESYVLACFLLRFVATKIQLGLIPLGKVMGMEILGWSCMYMLVGSDEKPSPTAHGSTRRRFRRLGVMVLAEELLTDEPLRGEFSIY